MERHFIEKALEQTRGNQIMAAELLGINRNTICSKIGKFNIDISRFEV